MIKKYLEYALYTKNLSIGTVKRYKKGLKKFDCYLKSIWKTAENPEEILLDDVFSFVAYMRKSGLLPQTCNTILVCVKSYLRYLRDILDMDVLDNRRIVNCKTQQSCIWFYNNDQKKQILELVNSGFGVFNNTQLRNKILTYMLLNTGLRCHEIAKIKVKEIWENLQVIGKWWKRRTVYLKSELLDMIREYLSKRKKESEYLFPATTEWHIRESSIRWIYCKMSHNLGFRIHAHKFRHTFATDLLHIPWSNIYNVARLLWHSNINTTQIYLWLDDSELKKLQFSLNY